MDETERVPEMKRELLKLVEQIIAEEDPPLESINKAKQILAELNKFWFTRSLKNLENFLHCHDSMVVMSEPVVISSGETYEGTFIRSWFEEGNRTCPKTGLVLDDKDIIPNVLIHDMILFWCKYQFNSWMDKIMSESVTDQREAAERIKFHAHSNSLFQDHLLVESSPSTISKLLRPLWRKDANRHPDLPENLLSIILTITVNIEDKRIFAALPGSISLLVQYLETGTNAARGSAASILGSLAELEYSIKVKIVRYGAIEKLIDLIEEGIEGSMYEAAETLCELCTDEDSKAIAVEYGAVSVLWDKMEEDAFEFPDPFLQCLDPLCSSSVAVRILYKKRNVIHKLLKLARESTEDLTGEYYISILQAICEEYPSNYKLVEAEETRKRTISKIGRHGGSRATEKANEIGLRLIELSLNEYFPTTSTRYVTFV